MEQEYFSKGAGTAALTTGIIGTALGTMGSGLLGNLGLGGNTNTVNQLQMDLIASNRALALAQSELNTEKKLVETFTAASDKINAVRDELGTRIYNLEQTVNANAASQAVINCGMSNNIGILQTQVTQLMGMTKLGIPQANIITASSGTGG